MRGVLFVILLGCLQAFAIFADNAVPELAFIVDTAVLAVSQAEAGTGMRPDEAESLASSQPDTVRTDSAVPVYGVGVGSGVWVSFDGGQNWLNRTTGLPMRVVYPFDGSLPRRIESLAYDPADPFRVAVATAREIYVSKDAGLEWQEVEIGSPIKSVDHISAVALSSHAHDTVFLGTSFSGLFRTDDFGTSWVSFKESTQHLYQGAGFYETIDAIAVSPENKDHILTAVGIDGKIFESFDGGMSWTAADVSENNRGRLNTGHTPVTAAEPGREKNLRLQTAGNRTGVYVNPAWTSGEKLDQHLDMLDKHGMDTVVVDMKDDFGRITFDAENTIAGSVGSVASLFDLDELLTKAHDAGIYVVGRIVVFQDPKLYAYDSGAFAVWDNDARKPWANMILVGGSEEAGDAEYEQREFWVDPYSEFVWRYNIAIADELADRGIDEVQFDYIRFPSDGDTSRISYRYRREGMTRVDAIESFLILAREHLEIPISTDLYGFNAWYPMGGWIGQNIDMVADYVDVVCPMFYPSHFPGGFLSDLDYFDRAETIYHTGSNRTAAFVGNRSVVRPYVQAFLIGAERKFETEEYTEYLARQLTGTTASKASGFTLWNASNIYYMITESLVGYTSIYGLRKSTLTD